MLRKPITIAFIFFCYAGINFEGIFGSKATAVQYITYTLRLLVTFFSFVLFLIVQKKYKKNNNKLKIYITIFICYFIIIFSSLANGNLSIHILAKYTFALGLYFYIIYCSYNYKNLLKGMQLFYLSILVLNLIFYFFIPKIGIYILGRKGIPLLKGILTNRNSVLLYTLPLLTINNIMKAEFKDNMSYLIVNFLAILTTLLTGSKTGFAVIIFYIVIKMIYKNKYIETHIYTVAILFLFLTILFSNLEINFLGRIIRNVLGGDLTLTGRKIIWDKVIRLIPSSLILGYGVGSFEIAEALFYRTATNGMPLNDPFNGILNILFFNGILGLTVFFMIIKKILDTLHYNQKNDKKVIYFIIFFLSSFLISISESIFQFTNVNFWSFIILSLTYMHEELLLRRLSNNKTILG